MVKAPTITGRLELRRETENETRGKDTNTMESLAWITECQKGCKASEGKGL